MSTPRIIVVGGGAAGFFAALRAKAVAPQLEVLILETAPKVLGKVKISGGGRCNVTTSCTEVSRLVQFYPRGQKELQSVFQRFGPKDTVRWFESRGVKLKTESDGRIFPVTDESQTIIDCLLQAARQAVIKIQTKAPVKRLQQTPDGFVVETPDDSWTADAVILAPGSSRLAYQWLEAMGHRIIEPVPSLFTFAIRDPLLTDLAGISFPHVVARLDVSGEKSLIQEGPLLITHWGLSGPVILRLSAWGARSLHASGYRGTVKVDFVPGMTQDEVRYALQEAKQAHGKKHVENECPFGFPKRFWQRLLTVQGLNPEMPWAEVPQKAINKLTESLKLTPLAISGKGAFKEEFVTAGGVSLKDIDFKTMQSRKVPGLYITGELLDIDALTGGYNFQNAWSTGWIAGESAALSRVTETAATS